MLATILISLLLLGGCAPYALPPLGPEHPASAAAPETPPPPPSTALAGDPLPPAAPEPGAPHPGRHGGHR